MTQLDFQTMLDALALQCPVQPSELIEDSFDVGLDDEWINLQWDGLHQHVALTVALPLPFDDADSGATRLALYQLLLERQWSDMGDDTGIGFGLLPAVDEVVGMAAFDARELSGQEALLDRLRAIQASVLGAWYEVCEQLVLQQLPGAAVTRANAPTPAHPMLLA